MRHMTNKLLMIFLMFWVGANVQAQIINTVAGGGNAIGDGGFAVNAVLDSPKSVYAAGGNLYIADDHNNRVRMINLSGKISTVAGGGISGNYGDGGAATSARLNRPWGIAHDGSSNLYFSDFGDNVIRRVDASGIITTIAGGGNPPNGLGDLGPATSAFLFGPTGLVMGPAGILYIADNAHNRVRRVVIGGGISTAAGSGSGSFSGDGGLAPNAAINRPYGVATDATGNLYIADTNNKRIRKVDIFGLMSTVAGNGTSGYSGDGGPATIAKIATPFGVAADTSGSLFIADYGNNRIRKVDHNGTITTVAGNGTAGYSGDGGLATNAQIGFFLYGVAVDGAGNLFIVDSSNNAIRKVDTLGMISTVAGRGKNGYIGGGGPSTSTVLSLPWSVAVDRSGSMYFPHGTVIRKVDVSGTISTVAGNGSPGYSGDGGAAITASLGSPNGVAVSAVGDLYIADSTFAVIRKVTASTGIISTVAGNGTTGYSGDGGTATSAQLNGPQGVALDAAGNVYISDFHNNAIRKITVSSGIMSTVAGNGTQGFSGDDGAATSAELYFPTSVGFDTAGNLYIVDSGNACVRKVSTSTGIITTIAGRGNPPDHLGDGGPATSAILNLPHSAAIDAAGNLYVAEIGDSRIRRVDINGTITTVAGIGTDGYTGDMGLATNAQLQRPYGVAVDSLGSLYIADTYNNVIRKVLSDGIFKNGFDVR